MPSGAIADLGGRIALAVVDHVVGAGGSGQPGLVRSADGADHGGAGPAGELDHGVPDRSGPARGEHDRAVQVWGDLGELLGASGAGTGLQVHRVDPGHGDPDANLAGAGAGHGQVTVDELENVGAAVVAVDDGFHDSVLVLGDAGHRTARRTNARSGRPGRRCRSPAGAARLPDHHLHELQQAGLPLSSDVRRRGRVRREGLPAGTVGRRDPPRPRRPALRGSGPRSGSPGRRCESADRAGDRRAARRRRGEAP